MKKKYLNFEFLTFDGYDLFMFKLKSKVRAVLVLLVMFFVPVIFAAAQNLRAVDDYAATGPMQKVRVNVLANDTLTCSAYTLNILSTLNPVTQGTATVITGGFIDFDPALPCRNTTITIVYGLTCNGVQVTANLTVNVTEYNRPVNVIDENIECYEEMPTDITFDIRKKYEISPRSSSGNYIDGFTSPLVGDLNGDGKPEIVIMGNEGTSGSGASTTLKYINIYNGQTGERIGRYDFTTLGTGYSAMDMGTPYHRPPSILALADLDNDGTGEIVMCHAESGRVVAFKPTFNMNATG
ncbi:MAG: VCBS repeat-containing protein, partial [Prevotellaceae bacterium]|nr:VCBS repeat-containing protein [Prevotellaceae bacterium]